ncbi:unnamed protein product [Caenorhabditis angaria]|uniref:Up-regulated in Daf-2 domain-containing protein n=1 Tax=Caenorhabditis angaria TaxID=860376 RepID=A0A9P1IE52_9PELO|nr:unnamed protein product [Caenorhabditis angaria]
MRFFTGFLPIFLLLTVAHLTEGLTRRKARIVLENRTGSYFKFQVLHQYTGKGTDDSGWIEFAPGDSKEVFAGVSYNTGFMTTGVDNWIIHGKQLHKVSGSVDGGLIKFDGHVFIEGLPYRSYHGFGAEWKKHMLNSKDDGKTTVIKVYQSTIEFISPSGKSSTRFDTVADSAGRIM